MAIPKGGFRSILKPRKKANYDQLLDESSTVAMNRTAPTPTMVDGTPSKGLVLEMEASPVSVPSSEIAPKEAAFVATSPVSVAVIPSSAPNEEEADDHSSSVAVNIFAERIEKNAANDCPTVTFDSEHMFEEADEDFSPMVVEEDDEEEEEANLSFKDKITIATTTTATTTTFYSSTCANSSDNHSQGSALSGYYRTPDLLETTKQAASAMASPSSPSNTSKSLDDSLERVSIGGEAAAATSPAAAAPAGNDATTSSCASSDQFFETSRDYATAALESTKERFDTACKAASGVLERSSCATQEFLESTARSAEGSPAKDPLEEAGAKFETTYTQVVTEMAEFIEYHQNLLEGVCCHRFGATKTRKTSASSCSGSTIADDDDAPTVTVAIEVQMKRSK